MTLSDAGLAFIKGFEGYRSQAYKDSNGLYACGYGHTSGVTATTTCTEEVASDWIQQDTGYAQTAINLHVDVPLTQNQFDALVSFAYNLGVSAFVTSTLLKMVNASDFTSATAQFAFWDHIDGVEIAGLERRRQAEAALFGSADA